jgi:hypothetical protein
LRILLQYGISKLTFASPPPKSKKEALDTIDRLQALTPGAGQNIHASDAVATVPLNQ